MILISNNSILRNEMYTFPAYQNGKYVIKKSNDEYYTLNYTSLHF